MNNINNIDFNDLLVAQGISQFSHNIQQAINRVISTTQNPPAPPSLDEQLNNTLDRYKIIVDIGKQTSKVWDNQDKMVINQSHLIDRLDKDTYKAWAKQNPTIDKAHVDQIIQEMKDEQNSDLFSRYYLIDGTEEAWDTIKHKRLKVNAIRLKYPTRYKHWAESPNRIIIEPENIWFDPTGDRLPANPGDIYANTWQGLPLTPANLTHEEAKTACQPILDVLTHLCNGNQEYADWVLNWLAIPLQKPGAKMGSALCFYGPIQGAGKSLLFGRVLKRIYEDYLVTLTQEHFASNFNDWASGKLVALFEEILTGSDRHQLMGRIKQYITAESLYINRKHTNGWTEDVFANSIFLSNELMPLAIEKHDRRIFVVRPRSKLPKELSKIVANASDPKATDKSMIQAFMQYLLTKDVGEQDTHTLPPMTLEKEMLIDYSSGSFDRFADAWVAGMLAVSYRTCLSTDLYKLYKNYCEKSGDKAAGINKFTGYLTQNDLVTKHRTYYHNGQGKRLQGVFLVVGSPPKTELDKHYTQCYNTYHAELMSNRHMVQHEPSLANIVQTNPF